MKHALYRHFDRDGQLLYVGVTNNPKRRLAEHRCRAVWADQIDRVEVKWIGSREDALAAEADVIRDEAPIFNGGASAVYVPCGDALRDWMGETATSQYDIADAYGISQATLSKMIAGKARVSLRFAAFMDDLTEGAVAMRYWLYGVTAEHSASTGRVLRLATSEGTPRHSKEGDAA